MNGRYILGAIFHLQIFLIRNRLTDLNKKIYSIIEYNV